MKKILICLSVLFLSLSLGFASEKSFGKTFTFSLGDKLPIMHSQLVYEGSTLQIATAISEGLFTYDPYSSMPVPALAEKYTVSGKTWRFFLRKNAYFENGDAITAETVKKSWLNLLTYEVAFPYASLLDCIQGAYDFRIGNNKDESSVSITIEDEYTLSVYLTEPTPHLAHILCNPAFAVVHPSQLKYAIDYQKKPKNFTAKNLFVPISSGPFKVKSYTNSEVQFTLNEKYWDVENVGLENMVLKLGLTDDEKSEAFNTGTLDWTKDATLDKVVGSSVINYNPLFSSSFMFFNCLDKNVASDQVRKALLYAIPYSKLREGFYLAATKVVFPLAGYPTITGVDEYNPAQAKKLIDSLKLTSAQKVLSIKVYDSDFQKGIAHILKEAWETLGFKVTIKTIGDDESFQSTLSSNDYSVGILTWIADFADPIAILELFRGSSTLNMTGWKDKDFDTLLSKASVETDLSKRYEILAEAESHLLKNSVVIPLAFSLALDIIDTAEVGGWYPNALDIHPFKFIYFKQRVLSPGFI